MVDSIISHYRLVGKLGQGGMGEVFLAEDLSLQRKVAIKFLPPSMQQDPDARKRFLREARAAAALDHPFICRVYDTGEFEGKVFIVMEYVAGETLGDRLARGPLPLKEALRAASEITEALSEAHEKGLVHRDLKPSNIMLTSLGHAKIMDFGLAKYVPSVVDSGIEQSTQTQLTQAGMAVGTLAYMSPEQARGDPVDARSDIFSLGVVLFETLSGVHPFLRPSQVETLSAILRDNPPPLRLGAEEAPPALRNLLSKATAKNPAERYQSVKDMATDLRDLKSEMLSQRKPVWFAWALSASAILLAVLFAWNWLSGRKAGPAMPAGARPIVSILIADFQNRTGEPVFEGTLEPSFALALEGAPFITCLNPKEAHRIAAELRPGMASMDEALARLVAMREGVSFVLAGKIDRRGAGYRVSASVVDVTSGRSVAETEADSPGRESILGVVGKLAAPIRKALGDKTPESAQLAAEETFSAGSLEAAHHYAQAQEFQWAGNREEAIRHYSLAIQLDPDFGRAYAGLAVIYFNGSQMPEAEKYYHLAMAKIGRMSEREKYRTRSGYFLMVRNYPQAIEELSALLNRYPADTSGINNLALAKFFARDMPGALDECRRAVAQYPKNLLYRSNAALFAVYAGDFETAVREAHAVLDQNPEYELAFVALALSELAQGRAEQSTEDYEHLKVVSASGASRAALGLADIALYQGRTVVAADILEKGIAGDRANNNAAGAALKLIALARASILGGNTRRALEAADQALAADKGVNIKVEGARIYVEAGQDAKARAIALDLGAQFEPDPQAYALLIRGELQLKGGNPQEAIKLFQEAKKTADTWIGHYDLGLAYIKAGKFTEADSEFEMCVKRRGEATAVFLDDMPSYHYFPPVYYWLGRAQEGLKSPAASKSYQTFLSIKEKSVGDPLVADARRRIDSR